MTQFGESLLEELGVDRTKTVVVDSLGSIIYHSSFDQSHSEYVNVHFREDDNTISGLEPLTIDQTVVGQYETMHSRSSLTDLRYELKFFCIK